MKTKLQRIIVRVAASLGIAITLMLTTGPAWVGSAQAICSKTELSLSGGINCAAPGSASKKGLFDNGGLFQSISNALILIIGAVSVLMVIIGALRYTLSAGSPQATAGAKDTILYAIIGVIVAILAYAIINFVLIHVK